MNYSISVCVCVCVSSGTLFIYVGGSYVGRVTISDALLVVLKRQQTGTLDAHI